MSADMTLHQYMLPQLRQDPVTGEHYKCSSFKLLKY